MQKRLTMTSRVSQKIVAVCGTNQFTRDSEQVLHIYKIIRGKYHAWRSKMALLSEKILNHYIYWINQTHGYPT